MLSPLRSVRTLVILGALHAVARPTGQVKVVDEGLGGTPSFASNASAQPVVRSKVSTAVAGSLRYVENSGKCGEYVFAIASPAHLPGMWRSHIVQL